MLLDHSAGTESEADKHSRACVGRMVDSSQEVLGAGLHVRTGQTAKLV